MRLISLVLLCGLVAVAGWVYASRAPRAAAALVAACKAQVVQRAAPSQVRFAEVATGLGPASADDLRGGDQPLRQRYLAEMREASAEVAAAIEALDAARRARWQEGMVKAEIRLRHDTDGAETVTLCTAFGPPGAGWPGIDTVDLFADGLTEAEWRAWQAGHRTGPSGG